MPVLIQAILRRVPEKYTEETNKESGAVSMVWPMQFENTKPNGEIELLKIKAKTAVQADAWRALVGKMLTFPVNTTSSKGTDNVYYWIESGTLPPAQRPAA